IKTLEMAENRFQALFKAARDTILIINRDLGIIVDANEEAEKLFELTREEIIGQQFSQLEIFTQEGIKHNILNYSNNENIKSSITRLKKSNEQNLFVRINTIEIELGELHLLQLTFHDITDIKLAEKQVKTHAKNIAILNKIIIVANQAEDISKLLNNILEYLIGFLNFDGCCIYLVDKLTYTAKIETYKGFPPDHIKNIDLLEINQSPYNIIFKKGVAVFNDNFPELEKKFLNGTRFVSISIIPLFSKFEIIGAILMVSKKYKPYSPEDKDLFISVGLQLGTAIEKLKNEENLRQSEARNNFLLNNIPFSIFRISKEGIFLDVKLSKGLMKNFLPEEFLSKNIQELIPSDSAKEIIHHIEQSIISKKIQNVKLILPIKNKPIIFQVYIDPIENNEVLVFLQKITRTW
ncbi:MAG: PAS domain-containing protein, partial [Promethearchaeota archaeon]